MDSFDIGICKVVGVLLHDTQSLCLDTQDTGGSTMVYFKPKPAHDWKITDNDVSMMDCLLYTSPSPRDATLSRMPSSA